MDIDPTLAPQPVNDFTPEEGPEMVSSTPTCHPITQTWEPFNKEERERLIRSMNEDGFDPSFPVLLWHGQVVDGRHRQDAAMKLGIKPVYDELPDDMSEEEMVRKVHRANHHRRANTKPKKDLVDAELKKNPNRSEGAIAAAVEEKTGEKVSRQLVNQRRKKLNKGKPPSIKELQERKSVTGKKGGGQAKSAATQKVKSTNKPPSQKGSLNSLLWTEATPEQRTKFIDAVGLGNLVKAAGEDGKQRALIAIFKSAADETKEGFDDWLRNKSGFYKPDDELEAAA